MIFLCQIHTLTAHGDETPKLLCIRWSMYRPRSNSSTVGILSQRKFTGKTTLSYFYLIYSSTYFTNEFWWLSRLLYIVDIYFALHPKHLILQDVIWNQNIKLDRMFMFALSQDIAKVIRGNKIILIHVNNIITLHENSSIYRSKFPQNVLFFL